MRNKQTMPPDSPQNEFLLLASITVNLRILILIIAPWWLFSALFVPSFLLFWLVWFSASSRVPPSHTPPYTYIYILFPIPSFFCSLPKSCLNLLLPNGPHPVRLLCPWDFSGKEYWSGMPFPSPGDLQNPGTKPVSPALIGRFFTTKLPEKPEKAMAPHSSTLAWKIPWVEEPGRLQSMESILVGHGWATSLSLFTFMHWRRKWQPTPVFLPRESQGWRSLVGCRLWGRTELNTTDAT